MPPSRVSHPNLHDSYRHRHAKWWAARLMGGCLGTLLLIAGCADSDDSSDVASSQAASATRPADPSDGSSGGSSTDAATDPDRRGPDDAQRDDETETSPEASLEHLRLTVDGPHLLRADGEPVRLRGVNLSGTEYACAQGWGVFEVPPTQATIDAMQTWEVNAVRMQLNEHCWLGRNGVDPAFGGEAYQDAVIEWIDLLGANDIWVVLGLSWSGPGTDLAVTHAPMANRDHSIDFWASIAERLADRPHLVFNLYGEPHDIDWECWAAGCTHTDDTLGEWQAVGMQELVDTVRANGASQPIAVGGIAYANDASRWIEMGPQDPQDALVLDAHIYSFNVCASTECLDDTIGEVARHVPVIFGEIGENDCSGEFTMGLLDWIDAEGHSYLAWTWNPWGVCPAEPGVTVDNEFVGPDLLLDLDGTPNAYGAQVRARLLGDS